ncbi:hypothetical protein F5890DRAFT_1380746, partial [Lentinula detonsa]
RLEKFVEDPDKHGPGLRCTYLDTSATSIEQLMASRWNQLFIHTLATECADIAKNSRDPKRFAQMDWSLLARDRVYRALLSISKARPRPGETKKEAL